MKYIVIVPDGMADHPVEELGGKTPLEVARVTNMDHMAKHGSTGLVQTIPKNMAPGSDVGNMAILGYDPVKYLSGRAPLEAANLGVTLGDHQVALRCNLVTIEKGKMVDYSAGHIKTEEAKILIEALNQSLDLKDIKFYVGKSYRHLAVLTLRDPKDLMAVKTVPPHDILGKEIKKYLPQGTDAVSILRLMEKSKAVFENHTVNQVRIDLNENPATMIWLWGQGTAMTLPSFKEKFGLKGAMISAVDLVNGIGRLAGLEIVTVPGATGYYDTDYKGKAEYALSALKKNDFVYIHVEAPDEAGHNGDIKEKIRAIENVDREIVGTILNHFDEHDNIRILVLPDHPTPVELRTHTREPVSYVMYGKGVSHDGSNEFHENAAKEKGLQFKSAPELMEYFLKRYL